MKIWVLAENTACGEDFVCEHGLSLYIQTENRRILFDMGQSDAFVRNAQRLGLDLAEVDFAVLSHGHYDHGGGLRRFLEVNSKAKVYISGHGWMPFFNARGEYIGLDTRLEANPRVVTAENGLDLGGDCRILSGNGLPRHYPMNEDGLQVEMDGQLFPDDFCHEQYLLVEDGGKRICFTGCGHRGIQNILQWTKPDILVGGMHLRNMDLQPLRELARELLAQPTVFYTGHCTGQEQLALLREMMGSRVKALSTGAVFYI